MQRIKKWWSQATPTARGISVLVAVVIIGSITFAIVGWVTPSRPTSITSNTKVDSSSTKSEETATTPDTKETTTTGSYTFELDENGMVVFPETTDPREAAAAAAATLFTVDSTKVTNAYDFREEAIHRITHPSSDYIGGYGQVEFGSDKTGTIGYYDSEETLLAGVERMKPGKIPSGWWTLAWPDTYEGIASIESRWVGTPLVVATTEELLEDNPGIDIWMPETRDWTPDTPGATLGFYYAQIQIQETAGKQTYDHNRGVAGMAIWCDAPEDGGLCGVLSFDNRQIEDMTWPRR